jgi:hypothetical protein
MRSRALKFGFGLMSVLLLLTVLYPARVYAHTLKVDGSIGVALHANPNDELVAGVDSSFAVSVTDSSGRLNASNLGVCRCELVVLRNDLLLERTTFGLIGKNAGLVDVRLQESGLYTIRITGEPYGPGAFQPFTVDFPVYAKSSRSAVAEQNSLQEQAPLVVGASLLVLAWWVINPRNRRS